MVKVSIIVPIYGVEKYIRQCIDSILAQSMREIEVILVDDASPDNCPKIIDDYAKKDSRIKAIHQPNGGYGNAVNRGIAAACGEYMGIVEPDDWIEPDMYQTLYDDAKTHGVDIVKGTYNEVVFDCDGREFIQVAPQSLSICPPENPFNIYDYPMPLNHHASIWTAIYRLDFIRENNLRVLEANKGRYADQNWRYETLMLSKSVYWESRPFYNYRTTNENCSSKKSNNPKDIFEIYRHLYIFLKNHGEQFAKIKDSYYHEIFLHVFWNMNRVGKRHHWYCVKRIHEMFAEMDEDVVMSSNLFTPKERNTFMFYRSSNIYFNYVVSFLKMLCRESISVRNRDGWKCLILFGKKIRLKRKRVVA